MNGTDAAAPRARSGLFGAALAGGIIGSLLTLALLLFAAGVWIVFQPMQMRGTLPG